jgi:hypothetical protein
MSDLRELVISAFDKIVEDGLVEKIIQEKIKKTIESILEDLLRDWSSFGKGLKVTLEEKLKIDFRHLNIPEYNLLLSNAIEKMVVENVENESMKFIEGNIKKLLAIEEKEVNLSEFIQEFKKEFADDARDEDWSEITVIVKGGSTDYRHIYLDQETDKEYYECRTQIDIDDKGFIYSMKFNDKNLAKQFRIGNIYGFESKLFRMYAQKTKIIIDKTSFDTYYSTDGED